MLASYFSGDVYDSAEGSELLQGGCTRQTALTQRTSSTFIALAKSEMEFGSKDSLKPALSSSLN